GQGGTAAAGVFGRGQTGVVGYSQNTPRDPISPTSFESRKKAGVVGRGETGVAGKGDTGVEGEGDNGAGVVGLGVPGVHGISKGFSVNGPGVLAEGDSGVYATGRDGPGVHGTSPVDNGGVFQSRRTAQVWIVPLDG